ncbi:Transmembrane protein 211 [Collichthys lucidus]|uniref:Transmembrane protein 211 n=1 Tax=Collichthys lucidus TaxID=240159 RepID=A0A4U5V6W8_COLLU|nr:Transmembrane protein 211 [Collichthys lucidus]
MKLIQCHAWTPGYHTPSCPADPFHLFLSPCAAVNLFDCLWEQLSISRYAAEKEIQVFIMAAGLLVYPFGLNSSLVRSFCGDSDIYYAGECQIGWGYMLAIVGVMLTVFLPFFAKYAPKEQLSPTPLPTLL